MISETDGISQHSIGSEFVMTKANKTNVILTDDHHIVRHAIKTILESDSKFHISGEADNADQALDLVRANNPDILIIDIGLPRRSGLDLINQARTASPKTKIIVLTMYEDEQKVRQALEYGASGYIIKDSLPRDILSAVNLINAGGTYVPQKFQHLVSDLGSEKRLVRSRSRNKRSSSDPLGILSPREREMFMYLADGQPNRQIAQRLFISPRTVETHRARVIKKLNLKSNADIIKYAVRNGLIIA